METVLEIIVRPTEIDVNGHVNNAKFVEYLEWGARYGRAMGSPYDDSSAGGGTVTVNVNLNYRRECLQGDG